MRKKSQRGISLKDINSFEVYPEIIFKEIFDYFGGTLILPGHGEYKFNGKHMYSSLKSKSLLLSLNGHREIEITSDIYRHATKVYGKKVNDYFYYEYWKKCQEYLKISEEYENKMLSTSTGTFIKSYTLAKKLTKLIKEINEFHEDKRLLSKIVTIKV